MKKAIIFGASGFIGSYLLTELLNNAEYDKVTVVVRKALTVNHPKLKTVLGDYHTLLALKEKIRADDVFITLGTTKKNTPDQTEYYQVDHDYPVLAAAIAKENGAKAVFLVTTVGANAGSQFFYVRTKGEVERDILALNFESTHIFRPSMLIGDRKEKRGFEKIIARIWILLDPIFLKGFACYRAIDGKDVAKAMNNAAINSAAKVKIYHWDDMQVLLKNE